MLKIIVEITKMYNIIIIIIYYAELQEADIFSEFPLIPDHQNFYLTASDVTFAWKTESDVQRCSEYFINTTQCIARSDPTDVNIKYYTDVVTDTKVSIKTANLYGKKDKLMYFGVSGGNENNDVCRNSNLQRNIKIGFKKGGKLIYNNIYYNYNY